MSNKKYMKLSLKNIDHEKLFEFIPFNFISELKDIFIEALYS